MKTYILVALQLIFVPLGYSQVKKGHDIHNMRADELYAESRNDRLYPDIVLNTNGRTGTCDVLKFTPDERFLLAAGDDKVVRVWEVQEGKLKPAIPHILRWSSWRGKRGNIYAMDISTDGKLVAIAGVSVHAAPTVVVLNRLSGEAVHSTQPIDENTKVASPGIRSLAFAPSGGKIAYGLSDGSIWLWDLNGINRKIGNHSVRPTASEYNRVRAIKFINEDVLLTVSESGEVLRWNLSNSPIVSRHVFDMNGFVYEAKISRDGLWVGASCYKSNQGGGGSPIIELRSLDGDTKKTICVDLIQGQRRSVFDYYPKENRLVVGRGMEPEAGKLEGNDQVIIYDDVSKLLQGKLDYKLYHVNYVTFSPSGQYIAIAGGENHEVTLWRTSDLSKPVDRQVGVGTAIWDVALSEDGNIIRFSDRRVTTGIIVPNKQGSEFWRYYDLEKEQFVRKCNSFTEAYRLETADGWKVVIPTLDWFNKWTVNHSSGKSYPLIFNGQQEGAPRCYCFLPANGTRRTRLLVGHYYSNISLYELIPDQPPRRIRLYAGHTGEVTSLGVSKDQSWFVSGSNDQTIAAWSLKPFANQETLGAAFEVIGKELFVARAGVDHYSPAWEMALEPGDKVIAIGITNNKTKIGDSKKKAVSPSLMVSDWVYDVHGYYTNGVRLTDLSYCKQILANPEPGLELSFRIQRPGQKQFLNKSTTNLHRPLWRFFPTRENQWVLWMYLKPYFICSEQGDKYIGWHMNHPTKRLGTPTFAPLDQFRDTFENRDVIKELLRERDIHKALSKADPEPLQRLDVSRLAPYPPRIEKVSAYKLSALDHYSIRFEDLSFLAVAESEASLLVDVHPDRKPVRMEIWVNDHRIHKATVEGARVSESITIPNSVLRFGQNRVTFQVYTKNGHRRGYSIMVEKRAKPGSKPLLHGVIVGASDYTKCKHPVFQAKAGGKLPGAELDAKGLYNLLLKTQDPLYSSVSLALLPASGTQVTRDSILAQLLAVRKKASAEDLLILLLCGHGDVAKSDERKFLFCCTDFDPDQPDKTSVSSKELLDALSQIRCRKLVLIDACRAGDLKASLPRVYAPDVEFGPTIFTSCDKGQPALEVAGGGGLFTTAIREALGDKFAAADINPRNGILDEQELFHYIDKRIPVMLKELNRDENAQVPLRNNSGSPLNAIFARIEMISK